MRARKCVVCGEEGALRHRFPHGSVWVCNFRCRDILIAELQGGYTIASVSLDELKERELIDYETQLEPVAERDMAENIRYAFWKDDLAVHSYKESLDAGVKYIEEFRVKTCPRERLPELIGDLKYDENIRLLESRLRGGE